MVPGYTRRRLKSALFTFSQSTMIFRHYIKRNNRTSGETNMPLPKTGDKQNGSAFQSVSYQITLNAGLAQEKTLDGIKYSVVPAVILKEGVLNGSHGPLFYPGTEIQKTVEAWNHKPVMLMHPNINGKPASSCDPKVLENQRIGFCLNSRYDGKLKTDVWLDVAKCNKVAPEVLEAVKNSSMMEVSTGLFTDEQKVTNAEGFELYGDKEYRATVHNFRPDHLAVLVGEKGAMSIADGAGLCRTNSSKKQNSQGTPLMSRFAKLFQFAHNLVKSGVATPDLVANSESFRTIQKEIQETLEQRYGGGLENKQIYIRDINADDVIFCVCKGNGEQELFRQKYTYTEASQEGELVGEAEPVLEKTSYVPATGDDEDDERMENSASKTQLPATDEDNVIPPYLMGSVLDSKNNPANPGPNVTAGMPGTGTLFASNGDTPESLNADQQAAIDSYVSETKRVQAGLAKGEMTQAECDSALRQAIDRINSTKLRTILQSPAVFGGGINASMDTSNPPNQFNSANTNTNNSAGDQQGESAMDLDQFLKQCKPEERKIVTNALAAAKRENEALDARRSAAIATIKQNSAVTLPDADLAVMSLPGLEALAATKLTPVANAANLPVVPGHVANAAPTMELLPLPQLDFSKK